jgi:hypothetical protein
MNPGDPNRANNIFTSMPTSANQKIDKYKGFYASKVLDKVNLYSNRVNTEYSERPSLQPDLHKKYSTNSRNSVKDLLGLENGKADISKFNPTSRTRFLDSKNKENKTQGGDRMKSAFFENNSLCAWKNYFQKVYFALKKNYRNHLQTNGQPRKQTCVPRDS